jgi:uncharacterized damage-inducible protein DinB
MKETLSLFAHYNVWANKLIIDVMLGLPDELLDKEIASSFSSLRKTVYHTWSAEYIWLQRMQLIEHPTWIEKEFKGSFEEACSEWQKASEGLAAFVDDHEEERLRQVFEYYSILKKQSFTKPLSTTLLHVFNHATYHRGQLVTMLRQAGAVTIPGTDLVNFA